MPKTRDDQPYQPMHIAAAGLIVVALTACGLASASANMYRWVDEHGVTTYTQVPPPLGESVKLEKQPEPSADAVDAARERFRRQREQAFSELEARKEAEALKEKRVAKEAKRAGNCSSARKNLNGFRNLGPRKIRTPDGRYLRLTPDEVKAKIETAQGQIETYCK